MAGNGLDRSAKRIPGGFAFPRGKVAKPKVLTDEGQTPSNQKQAGNIRPYDISIKPLCFIVENGPDRSAKRIPGGQRLLLEEKLSPKVTVEVLIPSNQNRRIISAPTTFQ